MFVTIGNTPSKKGQLSLIFLFLDFHAHSSVGGTNKSKFQIKNKNGRVGLPYDTSFTSIQNELNKHIKISNLKQYSHGNMYVKNPNIKISYIVFD